MAEKILGIMSGSSLDGLDLAVCEFTDDGYRLIEKAHIPFSASFKSRLKDPLSLTVTEFIELSSDLGVFLGQSARDFVEHCGCEVKLIVSHGHTIYHRPESFISCQIGSGGIIASFTGIDTLCDLRIQDVALGGQGAPLASLVDQFLFRGCDIKVNLGGIANVSVPIGDKIKSWDVSPCNQVFNYLANLRGHEYDDRGMIARTGKFNQALMERWDAMTYFIQPPPKSLDNSWIRNEFIPAIQDVSVEDAMNTMCHFLARRLSGDLKVHLPKGAYSMMLTGGGSHNDFLVECIRSESEMNVIKPDQDIIDYKEAILMAFMGYKYLKGEVNVLSSATGGEKDIIGGALYRGNGA